MSKELKNFSSVLKEQGVTREEFKAWDHDRQQKAYDDNSDNNIRVINEANEELKSALKIQGLALRKLQGQDLSEPIKTNNMINIDKSDVVEATKSLKNNRTSEINIPVVKMDNSNMVSGALFAPVSAGVDSKVQPTVNIRELFKQTPFNTQAYKYVYVSDENKTAEGVLCTKPSADSDKTFTVATKETVKLKATAVSCYDLLTDVDFANSEITTLLQDAVTQKEDTELVNSTDTATSPASLESVSTAFDGTDVAYAGLVQDANLIDLITVMATKIGTRTDKRKGFKANTVVMGLEDFTLLASLRKNADNDYLQYRQTMQGDVILINGLSIVYSDAVAKGKMYVFDSTQGEVIYQPEGSVMAMHWRDFDADLMGFKFYERIQLLIKPNNVGAFLKCESISTAISNLDKPAA